MPPLVSHVLLALAVAATAGAAVRVASLALPRGLGRAVAAVVVWGALVVVQALMLGLVAWGGSATALSAAAGLAWLVARATLPEPEASLREDLAAAWAGLGRRGRALAAALGGVVAAWTLWLLLYPNIAVDGTIYHLPEALAWVRNGRPGSQITLLYDIPVESYPLTDEVLRGWGTAIGRSFVWSTVVTPAAALLFLTAGWLGLRALRIDRATATLALLAVAATPVFVFQLNITSTDMTALAWLACCAALSAVAVRERSVWAAAIAIVGAGLAVGTKTTAVPLAAISLGAAGWALRGGGARGVTGTRRAGPLLVGALVAFGVGGLWYLRNLLEHGSPLWPFVAAPWGTPSPPLLEALRPSLLDRPRVTLEGNLDAYSTILGGAVLLLLAAPMGALLARRRAVLAASLAALAGLLAWANAPVTGRGDIEGVAYLAPSVTRYLVPAIAAAALALALAARDGGRGGRALALALLIGSVGWSLLLDSRRLVFPTVPSLQTLVTGALLSLAALGGAHLWATRRRARSRRRPVPTPARVLLATGLAGLLAASLADGFVARHARIKTTFDGELVSWFGSQPGFDTGTAAIAFAPHEVAALAGDRLTHPLELIGVTEACDRVRGRLRDGYVVIRSGPTTAVKASPVCAFRPMGPPPIASRPFDRLTQRGTSASMRPDAPWRRSARSARGRARRPRAPAGTHADQAQRAHSSQPPGRTMATNLTTPCSSASRTRWEASSRST